MEPNIDIDWRERRRLLREKRSRRDPAAKGHRKEAKYKLNMKRAQILRHEL